MTTGVPSGTAGLGRLVVLTVRSTSATAEMWMEEGREVDDSLEGRVANRFPAIELRSICTVFIFRLFCSGIVEDDLGARM